MKERPETERAGIPQELQSGPRTFIASGTSFNTIQTANLSSGGVRAEHLATFEVHEIIYLQIRNEKPPLDKKSTQPSAE